MACSVESLRDRRQHAKGVGGEKDDVVGMPAGARDHRIVDEVQRVRGARVLRDLVGIEIQQARLRIHGHVLQHRAEADGVPDLRLVLARKAYALGVAAAFEIEDAVVAPAVLVIADQAALGVGRERGLAGPGESEEERHIARRAGIRRAVHGEDAAVGQQVIHDREDRLLHFAGIAGAADQHHALLEVDHDAGLGIGAVLGRIGLEIRARRKW